MVVLFIQTKFDDQYFKQKEGSIQEFQTKGQNLLKNHKYQEAMQMFDNVLKIDQKDFPSLCGKCECLIQLEKLKDALIFLEKALQIEQKHIDLLQKKSQCLTQLERYQEAIVIIDSALQFQPKNIDLLLNKSIKFQIRHMFKENEKI
ncbi:unnamed protein product [Paramecium sonneborni]|uniref:Tetratricopeptide repeat protein n=1 Tax=Paramecium sonneborni TaxID=65129 RepID=A0A8S1RAQ1_9CILI|nr:unnamed protein product [Paramecium sonneborni]